MKGERKKNLKAELLLRPQWTEEEIHQGKPWWRWIDQHVENGLLEFEKGEFLGFLRTLFGRDLEGWGIPLGVPDQGLPDDEAFVQIVRRLREVWSAEQYGPLDWLLADAAVSSVNPEKLLRNARRLHIFPGASSVLVHYIVVVSIHLRRAPPSVHPFEEMDGRWDYVDTRLLLEQLPVLVARVIEADEQNSLEREIPGAEVGVEVERLPERVLLLWTIAISLDPSLFPDYLTHRDFDPKISTRSNLIKRLADLTYPGTNRAIPVSAVMNLIHEILDLDPIGWSNYGLPHPWLVDYPVDGRFSVIPIPYQTSSLFGSVLENDIMTLKNLIPVTNSDVLTRKFLAAL